MKNKVRLFGIYFPVYLTVLLISVILRTVALFIDFSPSTGYYGNEIIISIADYTVVAAVVFLFSYTFIARRDINLIPNFTNSATYIPTAVVSLALVFIVRSIAEQHASIRGYINYIRQYIAHIDPQSAAQQISSQKILLVLLTVSFVFAVLSIAHFIMVALVESHSSTKRAYLGLCTTIFFSVYAAYLYFSTNLPINAPNKVLDQITFLFLASFFLFEARLSIGREKWRGYIAFGFITSLLSAYSSIPSIIYYFATQTSTANSVYETALMFALFIFITSRVLLTGALIEDKPSATVEALIACADERDKSVNPPSQSCGIIEIEGEQLPSTEDGIDDENQLTIDDMGIEPFDVDSEESVIAEENE